jgi:beta-phosphoglucomutase
MPQPILAYLFDLNGTMIDDMAFHVQAWHQYLTVELKAKLSLDQVKAQMFGKNSEVLDRIFGPDYFTQAQKEFISMQKEKLYQQAFKPHLRLIRGLAAFLERSRQRGMYMAIGSAAIPFNVDFVLDNLHIRKYFQAIVSAEDVIRSKPDPETYLKAATLLGVEPKYCVVFEDAPKGVESALRAAMRCVVVTTMHLPQEFSSYDNILGFIPDYSGPIERLLA